MVRTTRRSLRSVLRERDTCPKRYTEKCNGKYQTEVQKDAATHCLVGPQCGKDLVLERLQVAAPIRLRIRFPVEVLDLFVSGEHHR